jgi:hypothetical protein
MLLQRYGAAASLSFPQSETHQTCRILQGRNLTILNYRTRFLFGLFTVWLVSSTYYSMVRLDKIIS